MENIEIKVKNEIQNIMNSVEYLSECIKTYILFNKGLIQGQKSSITLLKKQIEEHKKQIGYLQGNNNDYASDIMELKENIKRQIQGKNNELDNNTIGDKFIKNILKINNDKACETIEHNFYEYLFKKQDNNEVEYEK